MSQERVQQRWDRVFGHGEPYTTLYSEIIDRFDGTEEAWQLSSLLSVLDASYDNEEDVYCHHGYRWVQISAQQLKNRLTAWEEDHIKYLLSRLVELGWLLVVAWPLPGTREAVWYTIDTDRLQQFLGSSDLRDVHEPSRREWIAH